jgi:hypothetical protein
LLNIIQLIQHVIQQNIVQLFILKKQKVRKSYLEILEKILSGQMEESGSRRAGMLYLGAATGYSTDRMHSDHAPSPDRAGLRALPLAASFVAIPLASAGARFIDASGESAAFLPWLLLAGIGVLAALRRPAPGEPPRRSFPFGVALFTMLCAGLILYTPALVSGLAPLLPHLAELSPLVMLLLCFLWAATFGLPDRADLQRYGALLGALCLADLVLELALFRAVPAVRLIGNADILAGLLLVSLCAGLRPGESEGGLPEPDQGRPLWRGLVMLGLLACLSRPGLFAGAWVFLCFGRGGLGRRALYCALCAALFAATFYLPATASDSARFVDYWLWLEALRLWGQDPAALLTGFPLSTPLPIDFPMGMGPIWEAATRSPTPFGVSVSQIPSFWLRAIMGWGLAAPATLLAVLIPLLLRRPTRLGAGLTAALFAQGMSTPLLYDPAMAAPIGLAFILALRLPENTVAQQPEPTAAPHEATPDAGTDPVDEWDLRPL